MFQDAMDLTDTGLFELRRRLEAYADARLSPSLEATTRMRAYVMTAAKHGMRVEFTNQQAIQQVYQQYAIRFQKGLERERDVLER